MCRLWCGIFLVISTVSMFADMVNAKSLAPKITVEGASFRKFNLYLSDNNQSIRSIVVNDLSIVGGFNLVKNKPGISELALKKQGCEGVSHLSLIVLNNKIEASIVHKNLVNKQVKKEKITLPTKDLRKLAHRLSKSIYEYYIGPENIFLSQIAAVKREASGSQIVLMDFDGQNEQVLTKNSWVKSSPQFSPDGKNIIYTVITPKGQKIVEQEIGKDKINIISQKNGINMDAHILPDNSSVLATLSFGKKADIYQLSRKGSVMKAITSGLGSNLSPSISSDGNTIAFVSNRSGSPQIYTKSLVDKKPAVRLTFQGKYNQTPSFSPDGNTIAFTGRDEKKVFDIFMIDRVSKKISRLTQNQGRNQDPVFSSSGKLIIFVSEREKKFRPDLYISWLNGSHQHRITDQKSNNALGYYSPVIRPIQ